jgi:hypothetical protein
MNGHDPHQDRDRRRAPLYSIAATANDVRALAIAVAATKGFGILIARSCRSGLG